VEGRREEIMCGGQKKNIKNILSSSPLRGSRGVAHQFIARPRASATGAKMRASELASFFNYRPRYVQDCI